MNDATISVNSQNSNKWDPNQEGPRFKEFLALKKEKTSRLMKARFQNSHQLLFLNA